jgi:hypothetical protein
MLERLVSKEFKEFSLFPIGHKETPRSQIFVLDCKQRIRRENQRGEQQWP